MKTKIQRLTKNKFARNVAIVATGTAGAQAITIAFAPIITRLYSPEAFGQLGVFIAIVAVFTPIAALTYPIAIVLPKEDVDAKGIARLSVYLAVGISGLVALVLLVAGDSLLKILSAEAIAAFILLIPLAMLFSALLQIAQQWLIRKKQFKITAKVAVAQALIVNSAKIGIGWFYPVAAVLIIISVIGNLLYAAMLVIGIKRAETSQTISQKTDKNVPQSKPSLSKLAKRHYDFPLYRAPQIFINTVSQNLPILMLASFFGPAAAGFYTIGKTVLGIPSMLISQSVGDVFYPRITVAAHNGENLTRLILKATLVLAALGFLPFAIVIAFGPWLFGFIFGSEWVMAGEYARWLSLWLYFGFINRPSVAAIPALGLQGGLLFYELFSTGTKLLALYMGFFIKKSDIVAIALFSIFGLIAYVVLIAWVLFASMKFCKKENN